MQNFTIFILWGEAASSGRRKPRLFDQPVVKQLFRIPSRAIAVETIPAFSYQ